MQRLLIASPHCYADLARLWYRFVRRDLVPSFADAGYQVTVVIYRDVNAQQFREKDFQGATLCAPGPRARDFMEFYDFALVEAHDFLLILDADAFIVDGAWATSQLLRFEDPSVSAVSLVPRKNSPAIYAILCRCEHFRELTPPVFPGHYQSPESWPNSINLQPGDLAFQRLLAAGKKIITIDVQESERHVANFHGTTVVRLCRDLFADQIGDSQFEDLIQRERYYTVGAYDNALLGALYERLFDEAYAPDCSGTPLGGSLSLPRLRSILTRISKPEQRSTLRRWFESSDRAILSMAAHESIDLAIPDLIPQDWNAS